LGVPAILQVSGNSVTEKLMNLYESIDVWKKAGRAQPFDIAASSRSGSDPAGRSFEYSTLAKAIAAHDNEFPKQTPDFP
jgi:hypothetical protein